MSAHDLALGLMCGSLTAASFWAGVWVQRGYQSDDLRSARKALARCALLAEKCRAVADGLDGCEEDAEAMALQEQLRKFGHLIFCAITDTRDPHMPEWTESR